MAEYDESGGKQKNHKKEVALSFYGHLHGMRTHGSKNTRRELVRWNNQYYDM